MKVGVLAEPPLPGECKKGLLAAHGADWIAGFYDAVLRDVLDGAQSICADEYVVFTTSGSEALERQVPVPWRVVVQPDEERGSRIAHAFASFGERAVLFTGDAPSFDVDPFARLLEEEGVVAVPSEGGELCAIAASKYRTARRRSSGAPALGSPRRGPQRTSLLLAGRRRGPGRVPPLVGIGYPGASR